MSLLGCLHHGCGEFFDQRQHQQQYWERHEPRYPPRTYPEVNKLRRPACAAQGAHERYDAGH